MDAHTPCCLGRQVDHPFPLPRVLGTPVHVFWELSSDRRGDPLTGLRDDRCVVDVGGQRVCRLGLRLCEGRRVYCEAEESGDH